MQEAGLGDRLRTESVHILQGMLIHRQAIKPIQAGKWSRRLRVTLRCDLVPGLGE